MTLQSQLIAFSGGQDSFWLLLLKNFNRHKQRIVHINHLLQQDNFITSKNHIKIQFYLHYTHHMSVPCYKFKNETNNCYWRYIIFLRLLKWYKYYYLAIAKTSTDHYEHFFLNLCRGCLINYHLQQQIKLYITDYRCNFYLL